MAPLNVYLITFNCARTLVDVESFAHHLFRRGDRQTSVGHFPDLLVLSLQELAPVAYSLLGGTLLIPYFSRLTQAVDKATAGTLKLVASHNAGMTAIMFFAKPSVGAQIQSLQQADVGVGEWGLGNKGAVGIRLDFTQDRGITFVAAHLAPFEEAWQRRNQDWENIVRQMAFSNVLNWQKKSDATRQPGKAKADEKASSLFVPNSPIFLAGDLNYRTSDVGPKTDAHRSFPQPGVSNHSSLIALKEKDQLSRERTAQRTLHQLEELPVNFPPSYKYSQKHPEVWDLNGKEPITWHWAKHRFPSWCDRILFSSYLSLVTGGFKAGSYDALPLQQTSDHRPVGLSFSIDLDLISGSGVARDVAPPFPLDPLWEQKRAAARGRELAVGVFAYLALTWEGNGLVLASIAGAVGVWFMYTSMAT